MAKDNLNIQHGLLFTKHKVILENLQMEQVIYKFEEHKIMGCCTLKCGGITSMVLGIAILLAGSIGGFVGFPALFKSEVRKQAVLENGTDTWAAWMEPPVGIYQNFTFFNVLNPDEVLSGGKPSLSEVGPFVYRQDRKKIIVNAETPDGTIIYKEIKYWFFDAEKSAPLKEDTVVTIINPVLTANGTDDGNFEIETGKNNPDNLGLIRSWQNSPYLDNYWHNLDGQNSCNKINGTDGSIFGPFTIGTDKTQRLYVFSTDLCRSLYLTYNSDITHFGIKTRRYTSPQAALASPVDNPENLCFCHDIDHPELCHGATLGLESCQFGAPVVMSTPHFYTTTSSELRSDFDGINPSRELHETYLDLDPIVSVPLKARKRIQINLRVKKSYPFPSFQGLKKDYYFPVLWVEEGADIDQATADLLKAQVYAVIYALDITGWAITSIGMILTLAGLLLTVQAFKKSKNDV
ncbi:platelet glycoprotein 4-like isoform X3 [Artemia franciscana]|uniref:platelet glycoprotein 4-like isoform X3 n=1 Tax=Artemia franciscana TaxID=6661 RepID=UPI0032DB51BA